MEILNKSKKITDTAQLAVIQGITCIQTTRLSSGFKHKLVFNNLTKGRPDCSFKPQDNVQDALEPLQAGTLAPNNPTEEEGKI